MKLNKKAWACLTEDEKSVLSFIHGMGKSSWEVGQMMNKSHYKFLEIKYRAERFLKMYTEHVDLMDCVVPQYFTKYQNVVFYFKQCLEERRKPMEALKILNSFKDKRVLKNELNSAIIKVLKEWEKSEDACETTLYHFIKEFDRWNNFRILPKEIQEPSAFKRRQKNIYKRHIRLLNSLPELSVRKLIDLVITKRAPYLHMPLIIDGEPLIIKVKITKGALETINSISYYLFKELEDAKKYIYSVDEYLNNPDKGCKDGLLFWPVYRDQIKKAINYNQVQAIVPSRKYLEMATRKLEFV